MAYDAQLVLHGINSGGTHTDLDNSNVDAVSIGVNATGNKCLDVKKTAAKGLVASLVLTEVADSNAYDDEATVTIQDSDHLDRGWAEVARFPLLRSHIRRVWVTNTVAFVAADITQGLTAQGGDTGQLLAYDDTLAVTGGIGYLYIEMDATGDDFDDVVDQTMNSTGTGRSTVTIQSIGLEPNIQMQPGIFNRRFTTNKRYVRANISGVTHTLGLAWILLTNEVSDSHTPEYPGTTG